ncbi:MAG: ArsR family transcriptional regulator, partial [Acidimicrobiales bacterium]
MALAGLPDVTVVGRITVASLLSGTSSKERAADATGGVLRVVGDRGILVCKDFGSIHTMQRDARAETLQ